MNRSEAIAVFDNYVSNYDRNNPMIYQKAEHSHRVAAIAERIAKSLDHEMPLGPARSLVHEAPVDPARSLGQEAPVVLSHEALVDFAWLLGLLHDIGRFEQVRKYNTFNDDESVDHAELGADILFKEGLIDLFPTSTLPDGWPKIAETAIRQHNKLNLAEGLDETTETLSNILRDADKVDIFRVLIELSYSNHNRGINLVQPENYEVSPEVMKFVMAHRCVPRDVRKTFFDRRVSHCCLAFELVYEESRVITREQGYLHKLLTMQDEDGLQTRNSEQLEKLALVEREIEKAWGAE